MKKKYTVTTIGGDGIGPEVLKEAIKLLKYTQLDFQFQEAYAGFGAYQKFDTPLPDRTVELAQNADAILFGAVTTPPNIEGYFSPIVRLRKTLDLYANLRPFFSLPGDSAGIDLTIVRENTEDLYTGKERITEEGAIAERVITKKGCERILRFAFEYAKKHHKKTVTVVHKANVLRITDGLFLQIAQEVAKDYSSIEMQDMLVDSCAMQLVKKAHTFEVIVTTNMFGDILSDEAAALVGGLGVVASGNIGTKTALFEPVHGSAPKYEGKNVANPLAMFFATTMMLDFLREAKESARIKKSILKTVASGLTTKDLKGSLSTIEFTKAVINNLE